MLYEYPPKFFPKLKEITSENYQYILQQSKFYRNFLNSIFVSTITVFIAAFVSAALAFAIARFRFPGRTFLFTFIMLTMIIPGIASVSIFNFLTAWEEFPWANTVINDDLKRTLPIAISGFFGEHQFTQWGYVFALSVLSLIPILVVFISCQRFFVAGLTSGGVKG